MIKGIEYGQPLTPREIEVSDYLCLGWTNKEIAEKLMVSHRTIEDHRKNLFTKRGVRNCVELVRSVYNIQQFGPRADQVSSAFHEVLDMRPGDQ